MLVYKSVVSQSEIVALAGGRRMWLRGDVKETKRIPVTDERVSVLGQMAYSSYCEVTDVHRL